MLLLLEFVKAYFNSIKVQLEHKFPQRAFHSILYFNSIKVQLELNPLTAGIIAGAFQFHKGTIRTVVSSLVSCCYTYFNSIKVQLEPAALFAKILAFSHFNSIKVQLEHKNSY